MAEFRVLHSILRILSILSLAASSPLWGIEPFSGEFRQDHHYSLSFGGVSGVWHFDQFSHFSDQKLAVKGVMTKFCYSFYLPVTENIGYAIGSSLGLSKYVMQASTDIGLSTAWHLPGLNLAGIYQYDSQWRFALALDFYMQRQDGIVDLKNNRFLNATFTVYQDKMAFADYFFQDWLAIRLEIHERMGTYQRINKSSGKLEGARIYFTEQVLALGLVQHGV